MVTRDNPHSLPWLDLGGSQKSAALTPRTNKYVSRTMPQTHLKRASRGFSMEGQPHQAGMSLHGETHSSGFPRPPITPYDVLFLVTTIVFGIAKAVTASLGATIVPTTLEWVGSVIVFLLQVIFSQSNSTHLTCAGFT
jgi:hypothetical protein